MTARDLIQLADREPWLPIAVFAAIPLLALLVGLIHGRGNGAGSPWRYVYSVLVYLACVPGMIAVVLIGYSLFFVRENLLDVSLTVYALPIVSMVATLLAIRRQVAFAAIPGFDRLSGLLLTIAASFAIALAIDRSRIWIFFGGSLGKLLLLATAVFLLARSGVHLMFRRRRS